eukprot:scaffold8679_cov121-Isochrysis_galbana.AAC.11
MRWEASSRRVGELIASRQYTTGATTIPAFSRLAPRRTSPETGPGREVGGKAGGGRRRAAGGWGGGEGGT